jgi:hypothetical protein
MKALILCVQRVFKLSNQKEMAVDVISKYCFSDLCWRLLFVGARKPCCATGHDGWVFVGEHQLNWPVCGHGCVRVGSSEEGARGVEYHHTELICILTHWHTQPAVRQAEPSMLLLLILALCQ